MSQGCSPALPSKDEKGGRERPPYNPSCGPFGPSPSLWKHGEEESCPLKVTPVPCMPVRYLIGEEGYCLTSLQSALNYVELLPRGALGK